MKPASLLRIALPAVVAAVGSAMTLYLLGGDALYFFEPREPRDLGDATRLAEGARAPGGHVRLRGVADLAGSLRVGRKEGDMRAAALGGGPIVVLVPVSAPPGTPPDGAHGLSASGLFDGAGRLYPVDALPKVWAPVLRRFQSRGPVRYVLVAGEAPGDAWFAALGSGLVLVLGGLAVLLAIRAGVRLRARLRREAEGEDEGPERGE